MIISKARQDQLVHILSRITYSQSHPAALQCQRTQQGLTDMSHPALGHQSLTALVHALINVAKS
jgi:hypothetical protein